jgi:RNA polymerase sigma-70 factor, Bacteroides expansion family 1
MSLQIEHILAFNQLYTQYKPRFIRFARTYVPTTEIAEDIVNDSFMYYWENIENIKNQNIASYLLTTIKHKCINYLKRTAQENEIRNRFQSLEKWELQLKISTLEACNPEELLSNEVQSLIQKALNSMSRQTRDILIRSRYQLQTNKDIAAELGISIKTVEYHIKKALQTIRASLKDYYLTCFLYF